MTTAAAHKWVKDECERCGTRRERPVLGSRAFRYKGGRATIKGRRLLEGIGTYAHAHDVICVAPEVSS